MSKQQAAKGTANKVLNKIAQLAHRVAKIGRRFGTHSVPRYVSRVDIDDRAGETHGWQVRYPAQPARFFSDGTTGGTAKTRAGESLERANDYLGQCLKTAPRPAGRPTHHTDGRLIGVAVSKRKPAKRNVEEVFVRVTVSQPTRRTRVLYVGTSNTVTKARIAEKLREGAILRERMLAGKD